MSVLWKVIDEHDLIDYYANTTDLTPKKKENFINYSKRILSERNDFTLDEKVELLSNLSESIRMNKAWYVYTEDLPPLDFKIDPVHYEVFEIPQKNVFELLDSLKISDDKKRTLSDLAQDNQHLEFGLIDEDEVEENLRQLNEYMMNGGVLETNSQDLQKVSFSPFRIVFHDRRVNGAILSKKEQEILKMSLIKYDGNLNMVYNDLPFTYKTIRKYASHWGIDLESRNEVSEEKISLMVETLKKNNGVISKTAKELGTSYRQLKKYGTEKGVQFYDAALSDSEQERLKKVIERHGGLIGHILENSDYNYYILSTYAKKFGMELSTAGISYDEWERVKESLERNDGIVRKAVAETGHPHVVIKRYADIYGVKLNDRKIDATEQEYICQILKQNEGDVTNTAKETGYAIATVRKYGIESGIELKKRGANPVAPPTPQEKIDKIIEAYDICNRSTRQAAKYVGCAKSTVARYWREYGLEINPPGRRK